MKENAHIVAEKLEKELVTLIRENIGPVAFFKVCLVVDKLPKTRSGKILRHLLKKMLNGDSYSIPATIEDAEVLPKIMKIIESKGFGKKANIKYEEDIDVTSPLHSDTDGKDEYE